MHMHAMSAVLSCFEEELNYKASLLPHLITYICAIWLLILQVPTQKVTLRATAPLTRMRQDPDRWTVEMLVHILAGHVSTGPAFQKLMCPQTWCMTLLFLVHDPAAGHDVAS